MNINDLFFLGTGLIIIMSLIAIFVYKKLWAGLALFGFMWLVMAVKDIVLHADTLDLIIHLAAAAAFFYQSSVQYKKKK